MYILFHFIHNADQVKVLGWVVLLNDVKLDAVTVVVFASVTENDSIFHF